MKFKEFVQIINNNKDSNIFIMLPSGDFIPDHFHITELGQVNKKFIDCGGTYRETKTCSLQVWFANDYDHRLNTSKLSKILKMGANIVEDDNNVEIEYGENVSSNYNLSKIEVTPKGLLFILSGKQTECLALDKCGLGSNKCC